MESVPWALIISNYDSNQGASRIRLTIARSLCKSMAGASLHCLPFRRDLARLIAANALVVVES